MFARLLYVDDQDVDEVEDSKVSCRRYLFLRKGKDDNNGHTEVFIYERIMPYSPLWIQVRDQNIPSREGISKQFWRFLIIASFAFSTVELPWSRSLEAMVIVWSQM